MLSQMTAVMRILFRKSWDIEADYENILVSCVVQKGNEVPITSCCLVNFTMDDDIEDGGRCNVLPIDKHVTFYWEGIG